MFDTVFTLPNADTMMERLKKVNDTDHLIDRFYPKLVKEAGQEKVPIGVVVLIQLAIHDYLEDMPPQMSAVMQMHVDDWIDALIPDETLAAEAKAHWKKVKEMQRAS